MCNLQRSLDARLQWLGKKAFIVQKQLYGGRGIFQFLVLGITSKVIFDFRFSILINT